MLRGGSWNNNENNCRSANRNNNNPNNRNNNNGFRCARSPRVSTRALSPMSESACVHGCGRSARGVQVHVRAG
ncbi:MAG: SUMF1/EgtB/PvdO family nonheme iron enzyme [Armatimonadetes bacterium]|nr:SUMF1/EgtB/PvdO family nonheme iron enzyme [Armatimonadota bacterium]